MVRNGTWLVSRRSWPSTHSSATNPSTLTTLTIIDLMGKICTCGEWATAVHRVRSETEVRRANVDGYSYRRI